MNTGLVSPAQGVFTGATFFVGTMEWLSVNSESITPGAVIVTALAAVIFGFWNAKSNSDRNKINRRDITADIISDLSKAGKNDEYIKDFIEVTKK